MCEIDVVKQNEQLESADPGAILEWVWSTFGKEAAATSSFQTQSVPLLHLIAETTPQLPILFLDTGFHFPETLEFRNRLQEKLDLDIRSIKTRLGHEGFQRKYGELHRSDPDLCCHLNKVEPLDHALRDYRVWISGVRRDQTEARKNTPVVSQLDNGLYKVCPMVQWTSRDVWQYINRNDLPAHPLFAEGYFSIGCAPCTRRPSSDNGKRAGRWANRNKTECGLHTTLGTQDSNALED